MEQHRLEQYPANVVPGIERAHRILEDHLHAAPQRSDHLLGAVRNFAPVEGDAARRDVSQP
jgi:hypothetical protein